MFLVETKIFKILNIDGQDQQVLATSYSQIETYLQCPYKWFVSYLLGKRVVSEAEALNLGTSIHETLEDYFNGLKQGKHISLAEAHELLEFNMDSNHIPYANEENKKMAEEQHHNMIEGLVEGTSNLANFMKDKEVVACEKAFNLRIDLPFAILYDGCEYHSIYINGSIDFIVKDKDGNLHVIDFKSGKTLFKPKKLKENLQLKIYSLVVDQIYGRLPKSTQYYFTRFDEFQSVLPLGKVENERIVEYYKNGKIKQQGALTQEVYDELINIFQRQYTVGKYPSNPTPLCSWCDYGCYGNDFCRKQKNPPYVRKDIPMPKKK